MVTVVENMSSWAIWAKSWAPKPAFCFLATRAEAEQYTYILDLFALFCPRNQTMYLLPHRPYNTDWRVGE